MRCEWTEKQLKFPYSSIKCLKTFFKLLIKIQNLIENHSKEWIYLKNNSLNVSNDWCNHWFDL